MDISEQPDNIDSLQLEVQLFVDKKSGDYVVRK